MLFLFEGIKYRICVSMAFFAVLALALPFEINFFMFRFFWFVVTDGNDGGLLLIAKRFLDGWQKKWDERQSLNDERKRENVEKRLRAYIYGKDCIQESGKRKREK